MSVRVATTTTFNQSHHQPRLTRKQHSCPKMSSAQHESLSTHNPTGSTSWCVCVCVTTLHAFATIWSCLFDSQIMIILLKYKQFIARSIEMRIHFTHSLQVCCWSFKSGHHVKFNPLALQAMTIKDMPHQCQTGHVQHQDCTPIKSMTYPSVHHIKSPHGA